MKTVYLINSKQIILINHIETRKYDKSNVTGHMTRPTPCAGHSAHSLWLRGGQQAVTTAVWRVASTDEWRVLAGCPVCVFPQKWR